jgi:hypothetical protein
MVEDLHKLVGTREMVLMDATRKIEQASWKRFQPYRRRLLIYKLPVNSHRVSHLALVFAEVWWLNNETNHLKAEKIVDMVLKNLLNTKL